MFPFSVNFPGPQLPISQPQIRDGETTLKLEIRVFEGRGLRGREENRPKAMFFLETQAPKEYGWPLPGAKNCSSLQNWQFLLFIGSDFPLEIQFLAIFGQYSFQSGLKKTRPFRFLLPKSVVLDWFMVSSCLFRWSFTCQTLVVNVRNRAKTTNAKVTFEKPRSS